VGEYRHTLSLWAKHDTADLSGIPTELGLPAKRIWKAGDKRTTPTGRELEGVRRSSYCTIQFEIADDLPKSLSSALDLLKQHKAFLINLSDAGVQLHFFVGWFSDANSRDVLEWPLLRDLADLRIGLDFDVYGPDEAAREISS
jgi:hypothetical protein